MKCSLDLSFVFGIGETNNEKGENLRGAVTAFTSYFRSLDIAMS